MLFFYTGVEIKKRPAELAAERQNKIKQS